MSGLKRSIDYFSDPESLPMDCLLAFLQDLYDESGTAGLSKLLRLNEAYIGSISDLSLVERVAGKITLSQTAVTQRVKNGISGFASAFSSISEQQRRAILLQSLFHCIETQPHYILEMQLAYHRPSMVIRVGVQDKYEDSLETISYRDVPFPHSILITPTAALLEKSVLPGHVVTAALDLVHALKPMQ